MTLTYLVDFVYGQLGAKFQLTKAQILQIVSDIQFAAFDSDIPQFIRYDQSLTLVNDSVDRSLKSKGPYTYPTDCRKLVGVVKTAYIDQFENSDIPYETGRKDKLGKEWRFANYPNADAAYSWVYYRRPEILTSVNDDSKILVPIDWHDRVLLRGALLISDRELAGDRPLVELYNTILDPFWASMKADTDDSTPILSVGSWK